MFCSLTKVNQLWGAGALSRGHCAEPSRGHDLWGLCLSGLLSLPWLSNKWDRWVMSHTSSLASSSVSPAPCPHTLFCPSLPLLRHPVCIFLPRLVFIISFLPVCPRQLVHFPNTRSISLPPTPRHSPIPPIQIDEYQATGLLFTRSIQLQTPSPHPPATLLIPLFFQVASFPCNIFPRTMNTGRRLKWWLPPRAWGERVHLHELIHWHLKDLTDKQRLRGCQHTTLISPWWTEWKNVSYLVPSTRSSSDRCAAAPKSIRDCTFSTPLDPGICSVLTRKGSPYLSDLSMLVRLKLSSLYAGMWELNVLMY